MKVKINGALETLQSLDPAIDTDKLTDEQRQQLREALKQPQGGRLWLPKKGEDYWCVCGVSSISTGCAVWNCSVDDKLNFAQGNVFKTEAEAEKHAEWLKALYDVKKWIAENCRECKFDWNDNRQSKWYITYNYGNQAFAAGWSWKYKRPSVIPYLENEQQCRDLIAAKTPQLKIIFGVES